MLKFNEKAFNSIRVITDDSTELEQIITILSQTSDSSRLAKLNHNCIVNDLPFAWSYYKGYGDEAIKVKVITFPMIKQSTGFRFYLDIEESGNLYISEGKNTNRTLMKPSDLNAFSRHTQKMIAVVLESIINNYSKYDLFDLYKNYIKPDYTMIKGNHDPLKHYRFGCLERNHEDSSYEFLKAEPIIGVSKVEIIDGIKTRGLDVLHSGDCFSYEYISKADFGRYQISFVDNQWTIDEDQEIPENDLNKVRLAVIAINDNNIDDSRAYFIRSGKIVEKWSDFTGDMPEIFVEHKVESYVYYNDIEEIILNADVPDDNGEIDMVYMMNGGDNIRFKRSYIDDLEED